MSTVTVYGASDDLVEIEGDLREEFNPMDERGFMLAFGDGTILDIEYDSRGVWRITCGHKGTAEFSKVEAVGPDDDAYSDRVTLTGDLKWCLGAEKVSFHEIPELPR